jgi:hypothetical protein
MNETHAMTLDTLSESRRPPARWRNVLLASTAALCMGVQDAAWAVCPDGVTVVPQSGFVMGSLPPGANPNWSPNVFTATAGSVFIPDNSVNENNDLSQPLTGGGHTWAFDQGSTLCKQTDIGPGGAIATGWSIPPNTATKCVVLPIIKNGRVTNLGDIPGQGDVITPTCNPALLSTVGAPNPANTFFNQLGCSISHGVANNSHTATSWMFVAGIKGGLFSVRLDNVSQQKVGGEAGKAAGIIDYFYAITEGSKLTNASVSPDGQFAIVTSIRRAQPVWACLNPLGDPGDLTKPINPNFFVPPASTEKCMVIGNNNLAVDLATEFGPDLQPYFGGQRIVNSFDSQPGGISNAAWPNCIWKNNGSTSLADAFAHNRQGGCGNALSNFGFASALVTQPAALIRHTAPNGDLYMYTGPLGGTIDQFKLTIDPNSGLTNYAFRTYVTGTSLNTGLGIAEDQKSLMVYTDPSAVGLAGQDVIVKLPLCEDM